MTVYIYIYITGRNYYYYFWQYSIIFLFIICSWYSSLCLNRLFSWSSWYIFLFSSKNSLWEYNQLIFMLTAFRIWLIIDLEWLQLTLKKINLWLFLLNGLKVLLDKIMLMSRKLIIFWLKDFSILNPDNLKALIIFLHIFEVFGMKMRPSSYYKPICVPLPYPDVRNRSRRWPKGSLFNSYHT